MPRGAVAWLVLVLAGGSWLHAASQESSAPSQSDASKFRAVVTRYCIGCHNEKLKTAGLMLDRMNLANIGEGGEVWEKVVRKLRAEAMPPAGMPRPDPATYKDFASYLETELDRAAAIKPNPGRPSAVHRLNRAEYANAIRDLFGVEIDANTLLPADDSNYGFDNIADALSVSPMLLERYISAAGKIIRQAIGDTSIPTSLETYNVPQLLVQDDRMSEDLPFGSRGGAAIRHNFPLDGEYTIRIRLQKTADSGVIIGLADPHQMDLRLDGERIRLYTVGGEYKGRRENLYPLYEKNFQYLSTADAGLEARVPVKAGMHVIGVSFLREPAGKSEAVLTPNQAGFHFVQPNDLDVPYVDSVTIGGPYNVKGPGDTPSRQRIFVCNPPGNDKGKLVRPVSLTPGDEEAICAKKILGTIARRAYRRPVGDSELGELLGLFQTGRSGGNFESGIAMALQGILVSPDFLFRVERDPANVSADSAFRLNDLDLASRLSFFLWSSIPDDELLNLAARGKLNDPAVLEHQVRRMLADSRSSALVSNFAGQWLYLRNLKTIAPDRDAFPEFDENLREAFERETELFFENVVREDRSVIDFLDADYTFVNERLARHYGIPNVYGTQFRRVTLSDENRRGLLGQGSILTATSYANRTSPTERGKWILDNFLGTPPPPPPPNVPTLKENSPNGQVLTMRQRMEQHRANSACAVCHQVMDPLGFALDNFDALGKWRTAEGGTPIDPSGKFPDGTPFQGPSGLRKALLGKREQFVTAVTERLLTYALGRSVEYYDAPAIRRIVRESAANDFRWSSIVLGIVKSTPFEMRMSKGKI